MGGRSIREWKCRITRREFLAWVEYYKRWPFDDQHRFHLPAALTAHSVGGEPIDKLMQFLQPDPSPPHETLSDTDLRVLEHFGVTRG